MIENVMPPFAIFLSSIALGPSMPAADLIEQVRSHHRAHRVEIVDELAELLALPNVTGDLPDVRRNAQHLLGMLRRRGLDAELLEVEGAAPAVFAQLTVPGARRTVAFYAHYDGQPVEPERWSSPPFTPTLRDEAGRELPFSALAGEASGEWRLFARSASDDKAPIVALLAALDALRAAGAAPSVNLKLFFEGEEENGSPHLAEILRRHADRLAADAWIFCDGPAHQSRRPQVVLGVRGVLELEITVYGPRRALHDGHYGNWAPNPVAMLVELLAGMRTSEGEILIKGFAERVRPLGEGERSALVSLPDIGSALRQELALGRTEGDGRLEERILAPALNLRGLRAGGVGDEAQNAIPVEARGSIDFRLVPDLRPEEVRRLVETHVAAQGYHVVAEEPDLATRLAHPKIARLDWGNGYPGVRTPLDHPAARAVLETLDATLSEPVLRIPSLGGSLPLYVFEEALGAPLIIVPIVNHDNSQHAADENLRLQNLWDGIEIYAALIAGLGGAWE